MELSPEEIEKTKTILDTEGEYLNDTCIQISLTALDTKEAREKFLIINEVNRQLPFNKRPEDVDIERLSRKLGQYLQSKFCPTQEGIILIYNRPETYFPERDKILQDVVNDASIASVGRNLLMLLIQRKLSLSRLVRRCRKTSSRVRLTC